MTLEPTGTHATDPFAAQDQPPVDLGVSSRALAIARTIDRMPVGEHALDVDKKTVAQGSGWTVEVSELTTLSVMSVNRVATALEHLPEGDYIFRVNVQPDIEGRGLAELAQSNTVRVMELKK